MSYFAILLLCSSPSALSCGMKANSNSFVSLEACVDEVQRVAEYYRQQGLFSVGSCVEVEIGEPV
jgi:hypothetical protein